MNNLESDLRSKADVIEDHTADLSALNRCLLCQICSELMTLPYVFVCGHTFCYGCSFEWLKSHKSCPTCRTVIRQKPVLCYPLKEVCNVLLDRQELLSPHKDGAALRKTQSEQEAFFQGHPVAFPELFAEPKTFAIHGGRIEDSEDHVMRCARCLWETQGPECEHCGHPFDDEGSYGEDLDNESESALETDTEMNEYDMEDSFIDRRDTSDIEEYTFPHMPLEWESQSDDDASIHIGNDSDRISITSDAAPPEMPCNYQQYHLSDDNEFASSHDYILDRSPRDGSQDSASRLQGPAVMDYYNEESSSDSESSAWIVKRSPRDRSQGYVPKNQNVGAAHADNGNGEFYSAFHTFDEESDDEDSRRSHGTRRINRIIIDSDDD